MKNVENFEEIVRNMRHGICRLEREGEYWTDEEKERLARLFNDNVGITEIAVILQRTERAVNQQIEKQGLYNDESGVVRRRKSEKQPKCLCERCSIGRPSCPVWMLCPGQEDEQ